MSILEPDVPTRFAALAEPEPAEDYNFEHFRLKHLLQDVQRSLANAGIQPAEVAPDFVLPAVGGGTQRLSDLRGKPVVLHFGSYT